VNSKYDKQISNLLVYFNTHNTKWIWFLHPYSVSNSVWLTHVLLTISSSTSLLLMILLFKRNVMNCIHFYASFFSNAKIVQTVKYNKKKWRLSDKDIHICLLHYQCHWNPFHRVQLDFHGHISIIRIKESNRQHDP
jgi:hypothetical protein